MRLSGQTNYVRSFYVGTIVAETLRGAMVQPRFNRLFLVWSAVFAKYTMSYLTHISSVSEPRFTRKSCGGTQPMIY